MMNCRSHNRRLRTIKYSRSDRATAWAGALGAHIVSVSGLGQRSPVEMLSKGSSVRWSIAGDGITKGQMLQSRLRGEQTITSFCPANRRR